MSKFLLKKRFKLDFLGEEWKDCYLDFNRITIRETVDELYPLSGIDTENKEDVMKATTQMLKVLKAHFLGGKAINESGEKVDVGNDDLEDFPTEVLRRVLDFLSESSVQTASPSSEE